MFSGAVMILEEVVLGKGLTAVDEYAFAGCTGLKQITIPEECTEY